VALARTVGLSAWPRFRKGEMGIIGGNLAIHVLNAASRQGTVVGCPVIATAYADRSKLEVLLGRQVWEEVRGKTVMDFGCGHGIEAVEMAEHGARHVIGVELEECCLEDCRQLASDRGVSDRCVFAREAGEKDKVDVILSLDAFEHFADPPAVLELMSDRLNDGGKVLFSFGPTWYHPLGGHFYSVFPWSHLLFSERALTCWRAQYKTDGASSFHQSGLNKMTIARFRQLVEQSKLRFTWLEVVPIRRLRRLHNRFTREFTTACVRGTLVKR
jgi:SAM-dependent methyltransferase